MSIESAWDGRSIDADIAWQDYAPGWNAAGGSPTGYATVGKWRDLGNLIQFWARVTANAAGFSNGTGNYSLDLPVQANAMGTQLVVAEIFDASAGTLYSAKGRIAAGATAALIHTFTAPAAGVALACRNVTAAVPMTWAVNDVLTVTGLYRPA